VKIPELRLYGICHAGFHPAKQKYSYALKVIPCATARDGGSAENAGAVFCQPGMVGVQKTQEQFSASQGWWECRKRREQFSASTNPGYRIKSSITEKNTCSNRHSGECRNPGFL